MTTDRKKDFVIESREHLAMLEHSLLALEKAASPGEIRELIERALRVVHSLKGDAGFLGYDAIRTLAHAMESLLEDYRDAGQNPPVPIVETLLAARDQLGVLLDDLDHIHLVDISAMLERLASQQTVRSFLVDLSERSASEGGLVSFFAAMAKLGAVNQPRIAFGGDLGQALPTGPVRFSGLLLTRAPADEISRVLHGPGARPAGKHPLSIRLDAWSQLTDVPLAQSLKELASLGRMDRPRLEIGPVNLGEKLPQGPVILHGELETEVSPEAWPAFLRPSATREPLAAAAKPALGSEEVAARPSDTPANVQKPIKASTSVADAERLSSLRIGVELVDRLMTLVGELTLVRNQSLVAFSHEEGAQRAVIGRLNAVTSELQETVLRTRMQPVGNLFGRFPRMVRDLGRQLGKQVEVELVGREVELDKTVLEQLSDPLTHLIRNSIDHGIESPEQRLAQGKPATGRITLSARPAEGQVLIEVRDDGKGIDPAAIKAKAAALQLKSPAELDRLSQPELFALIMLPGFSTAKQVSEVSGRGVGMDVVKTNLEQLEGTLTIDSAPGRGTSMLLRVPLTLAIIPCLIVEAANGRFAVPQRELEEVVCLHPDSGGVIEQAFEAEVFRLRDRLLPIVRLAEVLARPRSFSAADKSALLAKYRHGAKRAGRIEYVLVLRARGRRFGLLVDQVRETQEIVVKPMHPAMKRLGIFAGATLMGDGKVALIANVEGIADHASCFIGAEKATKTPTDVRDPAEVHRILIFECGPREQFALPLVQIRRVEMIDANRIEQVGNREFVVLNGVSTRVVRLEKLLDVSESPPQPHVYLVLPKFVPEPMAILVTRIIDTESLAIDLQRTAAVEPGILGMTLVRGKLTLFLDIQFLREQVFGSAERGGTPSASWSERPPRVLLIDDTPFFREVVKRYLEGAGMEVVAAIDGRDGLEKLAAGSFDLIISDIEMPNLDGWEFARAVREQGCQLPLLALTSLKKLDHEKQARACGYDDFQEKLDHDQLLRTVERMLKANRRLAPQGGAG